MFNWLKKLCSSKERVVEIELAKIHPSPFQPRQQFSEQSLEQLCQSIKSFGVIQPVLLRRSADGYECVAGERRVRAARMAGMNTIPAIVRNLSDEEAAEVALLENIQREDLNIQDEAESLQHLTEEFQVQDSKTLAVRFGKPLSEIEAKLKFLKLPQLLQRAVVENIISEAQAIIVSRLRSEEQMLEALRKIHRRKESLERIEPLVTLILEPEEKDAVTETFLAFLRELIEVVEEIGMHVEFETSESDSQKKILITLS